MNMKSIKLPFGFKNNELFHINDVERGKECNCICPSCKSPLIAAKGGKKQHHFKHAHVNECESGLESAIHLAAKKMIMERKRLTLSECVSIVSAKDSRGIEHTEQKTIVENGTVICFDSVKEEITLHGMKADILAKTDSRVLIIEIFYRHRVDDQKLIKIREANVSAIEINLSDLTPEDVMDWEAFWSSINNPQRVRWLYNVKASHTNCPEIEKRLAIRVQIREKEYQEAEIEAKRELSRALHHLKILPNKGYIEYLKQKAETDTRRELFTRVLSFSWHEWPNFINADIPNGDWIFGCDRRIWQTAFYRHFILHNEQSFSVRRVDKWLQNFECKVNSSAKIVASYVELYPHLVSSDIYNNLPSTGRTLRFYFNYLCELGMLEFAGNESGYPDGGLFRVISKYPRGSSAQMARS